MLMTKQTHFNVVNGVGKPLIHNSYDLCHLKNQKNKLKKNSEKKILASTLDKKIDSRNAAFFWRFTRKFHRQLMAVNFPSADWLSDLRTQLKAFLGRVCLRGKIFFLALFSRINFFA